MNNKSKYIIIAGIVVVVLAAAGIWYRIASSLTGDSASDAEADASADNAEMVDSTAYSEEVGIASDINELLANSAVENEEEPASQGPSLLETPLTYAGTVTPGGVARLEIMLFRNGRVEGSVIYSSGKTMTADGSYELLDDGDRISYRLTVSDPDNARYSESWNGTTSTIKDDLSHTLNFNQIFTSMGEERTARLALRL